jgi:hypothetical protein
LLLHRIRLRMGTPVTSLAERSTVLVEKYGVSPTQRGEPVCGAVRANSAGICSKEPGWGTDHLSYGQCKHHDTVPRVIATNPEVRIEHVIKDKDLLRFIEEERGNDELDNMDDLIALSRGLLKWQASKFDGEVKVGDGEDGFITTPSGQIKAMIEITKEVAALIKRKYDIFAMTGEFIPRQTVIAYMNSAMLVLDKFLRDSCSECNHVNSIKTKVHQGLNQIEPL